MRQNKRLALIIIIGVLALAIFGTACTSWIFKPAPPPNPNAPRAAPTTAHLTIDGRPIKVHALSSGNIAVKTCHQVNCRSEDAGFRTRLISILLDNMFADPMPILSYVIEHPDGAFIIDAGVLADFNDPATWGCDVSSGTINRSILQIDARAQESLPERLQTLNIDRASLRGVIITHMHIDHIDGLRALTQTPVYLGRGDLEAERMLGSTTCRTLAAFDRSLLIPIETLLENRKPDTADEAERLLGPGHPLTQDNHLRVYVTPGHTPGSLSVRLTTDQGDLWFIGDTAFTREGLRSAETAGMHIDMPGTRAQQHTMDILAQRGATILPAHDWGALTRLQNLTP